MKFTINTTTYDTNDYLSSFVDEYTGEVHPEKKVLNRNVRLLWFRSVYPQARIIKETISSGMAGDVLKAMPEYVENMPDEVFDYYKRLSSRACCAAVAKASIYLDNSAKKPIVVDYAVRYAEKGFSYNNEAALNAAADRAICSLGFIVPEEITVGNMSPEENSAEITKATVGAVINQIDNEVMKKADKPNQKKQAAAKKADIVDLVDEEEVKPQPVKPEPVNNVVYDIATPVEDIVNAMSEEDARAFIIPSGKYANRSVGEVFEQTKDKSGRSATIGWFAEKYNGKNNILKAACMIVNK